MIDVNGHFGPRLNPDPSAPLEDLVSQARRYGIATTLAHHTTAVHLDPDSGNDAAISGAATTDGLVLPLATIAPWRTDLLDPPVDDLVRRGVAGFRLGMEAREWHHGGWSAAFHAPSMATLLGNVARAGRPLIAPLFGWGHAGDLGAVTSRLGIPVILTGSHYAWNPDDLAALDRYPHLYLETSRLAHCNAIEDAVRAVGAERLVFGSDSPTRSVASSLNAIVTAQISDADKRLILGGNAARLFGLPVPGASFALPAPILPTDAIDIHTHYGPFPWGVPRPADSEIAPSLARLGIAGNVASAVRAITVDFEAGNRQGVAAASPTDGQFTYLCADPWDLDATRSLIRRYGDASGIVGVKVHALLFRMNTSDPKMAALFGLLADYGRPVKIHNEGADWADSLLAIAKAHPRLPIVVAHSGLGFPSLDCARIAEQAPNIHPELASSFAYRPWVQQLVRRVPREQILYGTDAPLLNPAYINGTYVDGGIEIDDAAVFRENARRIYRF